VLCLPNFPKIKNNQTLKKLSPFFRTTSAMQLHSCTQRRQHVGCDCGGLCSGDTVEMANAEF
jgi:hypothetical protein